MYNVLFMGGKSIGCQVLSHLLQMDSVKVVAAFTNPDEVECAWYPYAARVATDNSIPVYKTDNVNSERSIETIKKFEPDLIVVAYYDQILKRNVINIPSLGCVNIHFGLAEQYRGCYPTTWAIINGEKYAGVTLHYIDDGVDSGDIIDQTHFDISPDMTGMDLYEQCTDAGFYLFKENINAILAGNAGRRKQEYTYHTKYYRREFPPQEIHLPQETLDYIRAVYYPPFPLPYIMIGSRKFVIIEESELKK